MARRPPARRKLPFIGMAAPCRDDRPVVRRTGNFNGRSRATVPTDPTQSADTESADTQPADTQSADIQPAETQPADTQGREDTTPPVVLSEAKDPEVTPAGSDNAINASATTDDALIDPAQSPLPANTLNPSTMHYPPPDDNRWSADEKHKGIASDDQNITSQSLFRTWNKVVDDLKKRRPGVAASLGGIVPSLSKNGEELFLELPADATTSKLYLETEANAKLLKEAIEKAFGRTLEVKLTLYGPSRDYRSPVVLSEAKDPEDAPAGSNGLINASATADDVLIDPTQSPLPANTLDPSTTLNPTPDDKEEPTAEPSKEQLENILSNSTGSPIKFEEQ